MSLLLPFTRRYSDAFARFPHEQECLFAPLTYIKFEDIKERASSDVQTTAGHSQRQAPHTTTIVRRACVFPSPAPTIKDMLEEEQGMHLQLFRFNRAELSTILEKSMNEWLQSRRSKLPSGPSDVKSLTLDETCNLCDLICIDAAQSLAPVDCSTTIGNEHPVTSKQIFERILFQYDEIFEEHRKCSAAAFACDDFFREKTSQMLDSKRWCEHKLALWLQNRETDKRSDMSTAIYFYPLQQCFTIWLATLRRNIADLRCRYEELKQPMGEQQALEAQRIHSELQVQCESFLKAKGCIPNGISSSDIQKQMLNFLGHASVKGWGEEDLLALFHLADVERLIVKPIPAHSTTCLHLAAAHGNSFFLHVVFSYLCKNRDVVVLSQDIVHHQGLLNKAQTPLYLAAENGHINCITELLHFCPELPKLALSPLSAAISGSHVACVKVLLRAALASEISAQYLLHGDDSSHGFTPLIRAVSCGDIGIVRLLLLAGAKVKEEVQVGGNMPSDSSQNKVEITLERMLEQRCQVEDKKKSAELKEIFDKRNSCDLDAFRKLFPDLMKSLM